MSINMPFAILKLIKVREYYSETHRKIARYLLFVSVIFSYICHARMKNQDKSLIADKKDENL